MVGASNCLFCGIAAKKVSAAIVLETDKSMAFRDINPKAPVHVLVIPKAHIDNLMALELPHAEVLMDLHRTIQEVVRQEGVAAGGFRVVVNNGRDSGQAVGHLHYHVLGGRKLNWPPG
jgi:histidine triad (HIT) family protein